ncbi:DUF881 domain-containing protein [Halalkalibacterium halodurans]|uniref:BH2562 protein n=2 Tax=Halalkalibacterium halodurans TaxID=86665 RepID=Q9K9T3_HALH5|nr:DUF881 domain-containing protein [Halalkalibacterium halodurans]MDY7223099.1 DUF881 domain-containing protein [Halalkalibacterium halodurans]MDY7242320.1 DUF881 domain-containing protein [Halalkalibacterium halodurans]MED3646133.1 DUF881 domain-containing protein [Halalkalibacterium halodurans]MED4079707.1 DUF881 domain-containing protein [Halalkalibacterium halodurans]MED4086351.1 DUF881 domain-containing protein [Halalkalibacterium halodurans]
MKWKVRSKHVLLSLVFLVTGFILALSYELASEQLANQGERNTSQWRYEDELRNRILLEQTINRSLQEDLRNLQSEVRELEEEIASATERSEIRTANLIEDVEKLRKITGAVPVQGQGIEITLDDSSYIPEEGDPNNYIVHEHHVQKVVDVLLVAGAEAVAINGYRLSHQSYIQCVGPVITVDGNRSYAPFTISAVGDPSVMKSSFELPGGVQDFLLDDSIEVRVEEKSTIVLDPYLTERR